MQRKWNSNIREDTKEVENSNIRVIMVVNYLKCIWRLADMVLCGKCCMIKKKNLLNYCGLLGADDKSRVVKLLEEHMDHFLQEMQAG